MTEQGRILRMQERSSGNNGPTSTKRTPRCLKLKYKKTSIWMQDIQWNNPPLAPPAL
jgi:hypothetical protein